MKPDYDLYASWGITPPKRIAMRDARTKRQLKDERRRRLGRSTRESESIISRYPWNW